VLGFQVFERIKCINVINDEFEYPFVFSFDDVGRTVFLDYDEAKKFLDNIE
jgi:hypothetical protein